MRSANYYGHEDLRIEDVAEQSPAPGEVKLKNAFAGVCGSDLHIYFDPAHSGVDFTVPHPLTGTMLPQILGHEFSGTVVELGEGVDTVSVGDRVAVWPIYYCGECEGCRQGSFNLCSKVAFHGVSSVGGGMAEYTTVPATMLHTLPESVDLALGALVEPMSVAWHAVSHSGIRPDQTAVILGSGPIGIGIWFALRAKGVHSIIVSEPNAGRRAAIAAVGAHPTVDPLSEDLDAIVVAETDARGTDFVFDAAGAARALPQAISLLARHGTLIVVALHEHSFDLNPAVLIPSEVNIRGSFAYDQQDFDEVIGAMASGLYQTDGWVTEVPLDDVSTTFRNFREGRGMKVLVRSS